MSPALLILLASVLPSAAQTSERCYGVARAGANEGIGSEAVPGGAERDWQGNAWVMVPAGECLTLPLPDQPDGTPRRGSYLPLDRDLPA